MNADDDALVIARAACDRQDWAAAFQAFQSASEGAELSADDWFAMADAAWWVGEAAEHGYPMYFEVFEAMAGGDLEGAVEAAQRMQEIGRRFDDPNLVAVGLVGEGGGAAEAGPDRRRDGAARRGDGLRRV